MLTSDERDELLITMANNGRFFDEEMSHIIEAVIYPILTDKLEKAILVSESPYNDALAWHYNSGLEAAIKAIKKELSLDVD